MIDIVTLGTVEVRVRGGGLIGSVLAQPKRSALLAYLALARPGGMHQRDTLLGLFWPERDMERARKALRQALYYLRSSLGEGAIVAIGDAEVGVSREHVWCDATHLEALLADDRGDEALALYRGDLLPGLHVDDAPGFDEWLETERARLRGRALDAALLLAEQKFASGDPARAAEYARRAVAIVPTNELAVRRMMELLDATGGRAAALQAYEEHARLLDTAYDLEPAAETVALARSLRSTPRVAASATPAAPATSAAAETSATPATSAAPAASAAHAPLPGAVGRADGDASATEASRAHNHSSRALHGLSLRGIAVAAALVGLASAAALLWNLLRSGPDGNTGVAVFVAPFTNETGDTTLQRLTRMTTDWISQSLSRAQVAEIIVGQPAGRPGGAPRLNQPLRRAGAAHRNALLVDGAIYRLGDTLHAITRIVDPSTGRALQQLSTRQSDPAGLLTALGQQVVGTIASLLDLRTAPLLAAGTPPPRYDAYSAYVAGLDLLTMGDHAGSRAQMLRAARLDTTFIPPIVRLADSAPPSAQSVILDSLLERASLWAERLTPYDRASLARSIAERNLDQTAALVAARRMVELAPSSAEAHYQLSLAALRMGGYDEALRSFRQVEKAPGWLANLEAYYNLGADVYHAAGYPDTALAHLLKADTLTLDGAGCWNHVINVAAAGRRSQLESAATACGRAVPPGNPAALRPFIMAAREARAHGHGELALGIARRGLEWFTGPEHRSPGRPITPSLPYANILAETGDFHAAYHIMQQLQPRHQLRADDINGRCILAVAAARAGDGETARSLWRELDELAAVRTRHERGTECRAQIAAALGERDAAVRLLRQAVQEGTPVHILHRQIVLNGLVGYPPFDSLVVVRPRR